MQSALKKCIASFLHVDHPISIHLDCIQYSMHAQWLGAILDPRSGTTPFGCDTQFECVFCTIRTIRHLCVRDELQGLTLDKTC